jgi:hypothetical protein
VAQVAYFQGNGTGTKLVTEIFHLTVHQAQQPQAALDQAGGWRRQGRMEKRGEALMSILREYRLRTPPHHRGGVR